MAPIPLPLLVVAIIGVFGISIGIAVGVTNAQKRRATDDRTSSTVRGSDPSEGVLFVGSSPVSSPSQVLSSSPSSNGYLSQIPSLGPTISLSQFVPTDPPSHQPASVVAPMMTSSPSLPISRVASQTNAPTTAEPNTPSPSITNNTGEGKQHEIRDLEGMHIHSFCMFPASSTDPDILNPSQTPTTRPTLSTIDRFSTLSPTRQGTGRPTIIALETSSPSSGLTVTPTSQHPIIKVEGLVTTMPVLNDLSATSPPTQVDAGPSSSIKESSKSSNAAPDVPTVLPTSPSSVAPNSEETPKPSPIPFQTSLPTSWESMAPTGIPTMGQTQTPTTPSQAQEDDDNTSLASNKPTVSLSATDITTELPSGNPTSSISMQPTTMPSTEPSTKPTSNPSDIPTKGPSSNPTLVPSTAPSTSAIPSDSPSMMPSRDPILFESGFEAGSDGGFVFESDTFRSTSQFQYAEGRRLEDSTMGGILQIRLGGRNENRIRGMSGGWKLEFELPVVYPDVQLSFLMKLDHENGHSPTAISQGMVQFDGTLLGQAPFDMVTQLIGDGSAKSSQWKRFSFFLGDLDAGVHSLTIGGYSSEKSSSNDVTTVSFDNVKIETIFTPPKDAAIDARNAVNRLKIADFIANLRTLGDFGDREQGSFSYDNAAAWVNKELKAVGYEVNRHFFFYEGGLRSSMYVTKVGTKYPDRMFIISAHLDGRGNGGAVDDDASGSSLVLEMARMYASEDITTEISVRFVFWNAEEVGKVGSEAYTVDRKVLQGIEDPPGSGLYPEPTWLGMIQHDMILFDHGLPVQINQIEDADADIEYDIESICRDQSYLLAQALLRGNERFGEFYPAEVGTRMSNTDSVPFKDLTASVSLRENQRKAEIGQGSQPHWHQPTDIFSTYSNEDFMFGFNILQTTAGTISELVGLKIG